MGLNLTLKGWDLWKVARIRETHQDTALMTESWWLYKRERDQATDLAHTLSLAMGQPALSQDSASKRTATRYGSLNLYNCESKEPFFHFKFTWPQVFGIVTKIDK